MIEWALSLPWWGTLLVAYGLALVMVFFFTASCETVREPHDGGFMVHVLFAFAVIIALFFLVKLVQLFWYWL